MPPGSSPPSNTSPEEPVTPSVDQPAAEQTPPSNIPVPATPFSESPAPQTPPQQPPGSSKKKWIILGIVVVVIVIVMLVAAEIIKSRSNNSTNTTKKDIPVLNFALLESGGVPQYPLNYSYSNDTVLVALQLFEGLVGYQDQTKIVPSLATSWYNTNNTTWVFNLRHNVKFHSGRTMTAQDVKYSLDYAVAHQNEDGDNSTFTVASSIKNVAVAGSYKVVITTTQPDAVLLSQLGVLGIIDSHAKLGSYDAGTGPYIVKPGTTPNVNSIDLVASNNYWGGHVYTRAVNIRLFNSPNQMAAATAKREFDLAGDFSKSQLNEIKPYATLGVPDQGLNYIGLDTEKKDSPLQSIAARQAVAYALDIPVILKAAGIPAQQASQIVPLALPGHNPAIVNTPYDPAKAKQLLSTVSNASLPLTFAYPTGEAIQVALITKELDAVGFNIQPILVNNFNDFLDATAAGQYDIFTEADTSATVDGLDLLTDLLVGNQYYNNNQVNNLLNEAGSTLNASTRINDMQQVATVVAAEKPIIPLYTQIRTYALTKPYVVKADLPDLYTSVYFWKVYQK